MKLALPLCCLLLAGCLESNSHRQTDRVMHHSAHIVGGAGAVAVDFHVDWTTRESATEDGTTKTGIDAAELTTIVSAGMKAAMAAGSAATGDYGDAIKYGAGALSLACAGWAARERTRATGEKKRADEHKADAAEGWAEALKAKEGEA